MRMASFNIVIIFKVSLNDQTLTTESAILRNKVTVKIQAMYAMMSTIWVKKYMLPDALSFRKLLRGTKQGESYCSEVGGMERENSAHSSYIPSGVASTCKRVGESVSEATYGGKKYRYARTHTHTHTHTHKHKQNISQNQTHSL